MVNEKRLLRQFQRKAELKPHKIFLIRTREILNNIQCKKMEDNTHEKMPNLRK